MSDERMTPRPSFWRRLGKALGWLLRTILRLTFVLIIGVALGGAAYFGILFLYRQYVEPVQVHAIRLDVLAAQQEQARQQGTQRLDDLQARAEALEIQGDRDKETFAALRAQIAAAEQVQATQAASLAILEEVRDDLASTQSDLDGLRAALDAAEAAQVALQMELAALTDAQGSAMDDLSRLRAAQATVQVGSDRVQAAQRTAVATVEAIRADLDTLAESLAQSRQEVDAINDLLQGENSPAVLRRELQLVRAMGLMNRGRLLLVQNNLGLARSEIEAARDLLMVLEPSLAAEQGEVLGEVVAGLDAALTSLPNAPVAAADQLDGAWDLLVTGFPGALATVTMPEVATEATPEAEEEATETPTPEAEAEATPTAEETPTETPTPEATPTPTPAS